MLPSTVDTSIVGRPRELHDLLLGGALPGTAEHSTTNRCTFVPGSPSRTVTKMAAAPCRFYFVSDPTLLEILSLGSDPPSVVPHFQSGLFDSLTNVTFDKADKTRMLEMFSQQGEKVVSTCMHLLLTTRPSQRTCCAQSQILQPACAVA